MTWPLLHCWVDESIHTATGVLSDGIYLLAATVADPDACEAFRNQLRGLILGKGARLHWYDQTPGRRRLVADVIADFDLTHTVVIGTPIDPHRQECARRLCLERLLHELVTLGVAHVWAETRTQSLNDRDRTMVAALRSRRAIPASLAVEFVQPDQEPMLWIPDAVAGAVGMYHKGRDPQPYLRLRNAITEHTVRLR